METSLACAPPVTLSTNHGIAELATEPVTEPATEPIFSVNPSSTTPVQKDYVSKYKLRRVPSTMSKGNLTTPRIPRKSDITPRFKSRNTVPISSPPLQGSNANCFPGTNTTRTAEFENEFKVWMGTIIDKFLKMARKQNETLLELKGMMRDFIESVNAR